MPLDAQGAQALDEFHGCGLADPAIGVADDGDLLAALDGAGQCQRTQGAAERAGDDVAGVAQPDELLAWQAQHVRKKGIESRIDARQRDDRQFSFEFRRMQPSARIALYRPVIGGYDGFNEEHIVRVQVEHIARNSARRESVTDTRSEFLPSESTPLNIMVTGCHWRPRL